MVNSNRNRLPFAYQVRNWGETTLLSLNGVDGRVTLDGRTVKIQQISGGESGAPVVLTVESIMGVAVWTGVLTAQFSVHYSTAAALSMGTPPDQSLSVGFDPADKQWWDAMASSIMRAVSRAKPAPGRRAADKATADAIHGAPSNFDTWLNRTLGLHAQPPTAGEQFKR